MLYADERKELLDEIIVLKVQHELYGLELGNSLYQSIIPVHPDQKNLQSSILKLIIPGIESGKPFIQRAQRKWSSHRGRLSL